MRVRFWGCRGSLAAANNKSLRYGGNTSCVQLTLVDGTIVVLDAGTGIRLVGSHLDIQKGQTIHLLLSHLHMDHVEGLGFFAPLWRKDLDVHIWGPPSSQKTLEDNLARFFSPPLFPVDIHDVPSRPEFHDVTDDEFRIGSTTFTAEYVNHVGPTVGYRIQDADGSLVYMPDHEPEDEHPLSGLRIAEAATALIHDARYTAEEYLIAKGSGHSSVDSAVRFARTAGVRDLFLFHHDPRRSDAELDQMLDRAIELWGDTPGGPRLAREGMEFDIATQDLSG